MIANATVDTSWKEEARSDFDVFIDLTTDDLHNFVIGPFGVVVKNWAFMIPALYFGAAEGITMASAAAIAAAFITGIGLSAMQRYLNSPTSEQDLRTWEWTNSHKHYFTDPSKNVDVLFKSPPREERWFHVDHFGNSIPVEVGEILHSSEDGRYQHVKDQNGNEVGRMDRGGHDKLKWESAYQPHAHRPDVPGTDDHLPIKGEPKPPNPHTDK